ncbi:DUF5996 family protein [Nocardioides marinquilinus]|uniref:DUF5996 family protein n=1 Tax=Nocardioides marinquilinus TaxID=1210400 RepID=A0ABP9PKV4_9ACTN
MASASGAASAWPRLRVDSWTETRDTLHMWTQVVGKVRMAHAPLTNHWWQVTLYVSPRGLTTGPVPHGSGVLDLELDLVDHRLALRTSAGERREVALSSRPVADFYAETMAALADVGVETRIDPRPNEVDPAIPFDQDDVHTTYDPEAAHLFWQQLVRADRVIGEFRSHFVGKVSPVHFFWGALDLACTRFSGRRAPEHPGGAPNCGDWVMVEGYSRELSSCGFWPGGGEEGAFYSYAYPEPDGFAQAADLPDGAFYSDQLRQYLLPYEAAADAADPDAVVSRFLHATYGAAADLAHWDRAELEDDPARWPQHRPGR